MTIDNSQDIIDSRDIIKRIAELEDMLCPSDEADGTDNEEREELASLVALADEASGYATDWQYGEMLIRDSYFEDYAQELAEECYEMPSDPSWPYTCIDWEKAARELQMDYTAVDFDGVTYWIC